MSSKWLLAIGVGVAALVVVALVLGFTAGPAPDYPADTPEGTVQRFLRAVEQEDGQAAYSYLAAPVRDRCAYDEFRSRMVGQQVEESRVSLEKTRVSGERAEVRVRITGFRGPRGPLPPMAPGAGDDSLQYTFTLVLAENQWRLSHVPWPIWFCPEPRKADPALPPSS